MLYAQKLVKFAGKEFKIGEAIPDELVLPEARTRLIKNGVIAEAAGAGPLLPAPSSIGEKPAKIAVPILADEGEAVMDMSVEDVICAIKTIQKPEEEILKDIETIESEEVLILIDVLNGAKEPVHGAAAARAAVITIDPEYQEKFDELMKNKREELVEIAESLEISVSDEDTKAIITAAILEKQAGSDA